MRKVFLTLIVTTLLPTFAFGQDDASSNESQDEKPRVIIIDPELDPYGPLDSTEPKTETITIDESTPAPNVTEP